MDLRPNPNAHDLKRLNNNSIVIFKSLHIELVISSSAVLNFNKNKATNDSFIPSFISSFHLNISDMILLSSADSMSTFLCKPRSVSRNFNIQFTGKLSDPSLSSIQIYISSRIYQIKHKYL
jgi:hypothetical protein